MVHLLHLLKSIAVTLIIVIIPPLIITGGIPSSWLHSPIYQFFVLLVFAYAASPVISDFAGNHIGKSLFFPNRANLDHPTMSHIISLRKKHLYAEALEELRMLTEEHPHELEPYKMLLHLTAHELPDRRLFNMFFRKGMFNLSTEKEKTALQQYYEDHIQTKLKQGVEWQECSYDERKEEEHHERHFFANRNHIKDKSNILVDEHYGTLPSKLKELSSERQPLKPLKPRKNKQNTPKSNLNNTESPEDLILESAGDSIDTPQNQSVVSQTYIFKRKRR